MNLKEARNIASTIRGLILAHKVVHKCEIAGSIRREKPEVKDIEIVLSPVMEASCNLFGEDNQPVPSANFVKALSGIIAQVGGEITKGSLTGRYVQISLRVGITVDLFIIHNEGDFYRQLAIRTGNAEFSHKRLATQWAKLGYVGTDIGLCRRDDCNFKKSGEKSIWIPKPGAQPLGPWESEQDFFDFIRIPYVHPKMRELWK